MAVTLSLSLCRDILKGLAKQKHEIADRSDQESVFVAEI